MTAVRRGSAAPFPQSACGVGPEAVRRIADLPPGEGQLRLLLPAGVELVWRASLGGSQRTVGARK